MVGGSLSGAPQSTLSALSTRADRPRKPFPNCDIAVNTLRILGGLWLDVAEPVEIANVRALQRQRLAVLLVVWLSPNRRITRDKLLSLLWPESNATDGRARLSTAVYDIRRALGNELLRSTGDELWIPPDAPLACDADNFEHAIAREDWDGAVAAYAGALCDGVHLSKLREFDEWLSTHRDRLHRLYAQALERLLQSRALAGDNAGTVDIARALGDADPLSERVALTSADAITRTGDRANAVSLLERFVSRIGTELGVPAPVAVAKQLRALRKATDVDESDHDTRVANRSVAEIDRVPVPHATPTNAARRDTPRSRSRRAARSIGAAALVFVAAGGITYGTRLSAAAEASGVSVQLHDARAESDGMLRTVNANLTDAMSAIGVCVDGGLLSGNTAGDGRCVVSGQLSTRDGFTTLSAMLRATSSGASLSSAEVSLSAPTVDSSIVALARSLVAGALISVGNQFASSAVRSSISMPAIKAFVIGETQYHRGFYPAARASFESAVAADSTFALAHYRLSQTLLWEDVPASLATVHDSLARRYAASAPADEQLLIHAYNAWRTGYADYADSLYNVVLTRNPRHVEAWFQFAENQFHYNAVRGLSLDSAHNALSWVIALDSANWGARWHRTLIEATRVSPATLRARVDALLAGHADGYIAEEMRLFAADTGAELRTRAAKANSTVLYDAAWRRAVFRKDLHGAEALLGMMMQGDRPPFEQAKGRHLTAALRLGRGDVTAALPLLPLRRPTAGDSEGLVIAVTASIVGDLHEGTAHSDSLTRIVSDWQRALRATSALTPEDHVTAEYLLGALSAARGDSRAAASHAAALDALNAHRRAPHRFAEIVRALDAAREGNCVSVIHHLDRAATPEWLGVVASDARSSGGFERFLRARCLARSGRRQEAIAWYATLEQNSLFDFAFLKPSLVAQAALFRALGDARSADDIDKRIAAW